MDSALSGVKDKELGKVDYKLIDNFGNEFGLDLTDKNSLMISNLLSFTFL
jgi:hypothetical protein